MELFIIDFWHWWIVAVALVIIEILSPVFYALLIAIAAFITGMVLFFAPDLSWEYQIFIFATISVASIIIWRYFYDRTSIDSDQPLLNRRGEQYIGRVITLQEPIVDGQGRVNVDDSMWKIEGADCPTGTKVKIVSLNNVIFQVEKIT